MSFSAGYRSTPTTIGNEITSLDPKPVVLLEIATNTNPAYIRYTSNESDFLWPNPGGNTFSARPFEIGESRIDTQDFPTVQITIGDVDTSLDTWLVTTDFRNAKVTRYVIDRDAVTSTTVAIVDTWRVSNYAQEPEHFTFTAEPLQAIFSRVTLPQRTLTRDDFPGIRPEGTV